MTPPTRQGLTFDQVLSQSITTPGFLENFYRLCPVPVYRAPVAPIDRLVDESCFPPEELKRKRDEHAAYLTAFIFITVWLTLEPLPGEDTTLFDTVISGMCRRDAPELFRDVPEGVDNGKSNPTMGERWENMQRMAFQELWESINGPGSWDANPLVWVVEFKKLEGEASRA